MRRLGLALAAFLWAGVAYGSSPFVIAPPASGNLTDIDIIAPPTLTSDVVPRDLVLRSQHSYAQGAQDESSVYIASGIDEHTFVSTSFATSAGDTAIITVYTPAAPLAGTVTTITEGAAVGGATWTCDATSDIVCACSFYDYLIVNPVSGVTATRLDATCSDAKVYIQPSGADVLHLRMAVSDVGGGGVWGTTAVEANGTPLLYAYNILYLPMLRAGVQLGSSGLRHGMYQNNNADVVFSSGGQYVFSVKSTELYMNKPTNLVGQYLYSSTAMAPLGGAMASTHTLGTGDVGVAGAFEVDGASYFDGTTTHAGALIAGGTSNLTITAPAVVLADNQQDLTGGSATTFVRIAIATETHNGGTIQYGIHADDGTDFQTRVGNASFALVNKAGTEACDVQIGAASEAIVATTGSLTGTFSCASNAADTVDLAYNAASSLTETTLEIHYSIILNDEALVTPL